MAKMISKIIKKPFSAKKVLQTAKISIFSGFSTHFFAFLAIFFVLQPFSSFGQSEEEPDDFQTTLQSLIEDFTEFNEGSDNFDFNQLYDELLLLHDNPLDLNKASLEDFRQIVFLDESDIQNIISYRDQLGPFMSLYELQAIPNLTGDKIKILRLFTFIRSESTFEQPLKIAALAAAKNQVFLKWKFQPETARGFTSVNGEPPKFVGDKHHQFFRFNHLSSDERYGLTIEKDPGEKWTNPDSEIKIDYLSLHYQKKNVAPWLRQINLGDYTISMGQGLVAHSAFGLGKSSFTTTVKKGRAGIRPYNSVTENQAFRGAAVELGSETSKLNAILFASYAARDANLLTSDSTNITSFSSLQTSGLHRTINERADQDATYENTMGATLRYAFSKNFTLGVNGIRSGFDKTFSPSNTQPYQLFNWSGTSLSNFSIDYTGLIEQWNVFGEVAKSSSGGWAHLHGVIKTLDPKFDLAVVFRDFSRDYQAIYANAFSESTAINNEQGVYLGITYRPSKQWTVKAYVDQWRNEWLRFRVDGPGTGQEYLLRADFRKKKKSHYYLQYRYEVKDENSSLDLLIDRPVARTIQRLRLHANHTLSNTLEIRSRIEGSFFEKDGTQETGLMVYQDLIHKNERIPLTLRARLAYFNISDFDARIYAYENDLLFEYVIPSFSGEGLRYYLHCRYNFSRRVMGEFRWEQTRFFGAETIRSNDNFIDGSNLSRIKAQVRINF